MSPLFIKRAPKTDSPWVAWYRLRGQLSAYFITKIFNKNTLHFYADKSKDGFSRIILWGNKLPYIKNKNRVKYKKVLEELIDILKSLPLNEVDGELNYVVTKIIKDVYPLRYFHLNRAMGVLESIKQEFYRRVVGPYEDIKIKESGDV